MMIKLLICDDEPYICSLLHRLIDFEELDVDFMGYAYDGLSALELIKSTRPEIVITDIKMPGIDGLELIRQVREEDIPVRFVVISGFGTFDYARQAIRYRVEDYLVKPIEKKTIREVMEKLCTAIRAESENRSNVLNAMPHSAQVARRYFLSNAIHNPAEIRAKSIEEINSEYGMRFQDGLFQIAIFRLLSIEKQIYPTDTIKKIESYLRSVFQEKCIECESYINKDSIILFLNFPPERANAIEQSLTHQLKNMIGMAEFADFFRMLLLLRKPFSDISQLPEIYKDTFSLLPLGLFSGYNNVCLSDIPFDYGNTQAPPITEAEIAEFKKIVVRNTTNGLYHELLEYMNGSRDKFRIIRLYFLIFSKILSPV